MKKSKYPKVEIREMEIDDLAQVFHLGEELFTQREVPNLYRTWDEFEVVGLFQENTGLCLVAEAANEVVGFALGTTITKGHSAWKYGYLVWLGVKPELQRTRVAKRLFNNLRDLMEEEGVRIILVDTDAENHSALEFFKKVGFRNAEDHIYLSFNLEAHHKQLIELQKRKTHKDP